MMSSQLLHLVLGCAIFPARAGRGIFCAGEPGGKCVGYTHKIERGAAGSYAGAGSGAWQRRKLLTSKLCNDASQWDFLPEEVNSGETAEATDWSFTWRSTAFARRTHPYG